MKDNELQFDRKCYVLYRRCRRRTAKALRVGKADKIRQNRYGKTDKIELKTVVKSDRGNRTIDFA